MAVLMEGCGGNTCWATIKVEDKTPPVSICRSIDLPCYQLDEYAGPFETDNCGGSVKNVLVSEKITPLFCDEDYVKYLDRVYQATDKFGNQSARCTMRINLERLDLENVVFPRSFLIKNDSALVCDQFEVDENGHPSPDVTGVPVYGQLPLYPSIDPVCSVSTWYTDTDFGYIGCTRKIMRKWTVYEFTCQNENIITFNQVLEIKDTLPPVMVAVQNVVTTTNVPGECLAYINVPVPQVSDVCNHHIEVDVAYPGGFIDNIKNTVRLELPVGVHNITYTAYDGCGNSSRMSFTATVEDRTAPAAHCKGVLVTSLNSKGESYILPKNVNDGSYDACGITTMLITRVPVSGLVNPKDYDTSVDFDCADAGKSVMVALMVTDESGNTNSCMMTVMVQDKYAPLITCPPAKEISCSEVFTGMSLLQFGDATAVDACGATVREGAPLFELNSCRVGRIVRTFTATDNLGSATCTQQIHVNYEEGFNPEEDIVWPADYSVTDKCGIEDLRPENLPAQYGYPRLTQSDCGLAASQYEDDVFSFVSGACYKIVRTWTVIDWCEMDRLGDDYIPETHQQIIKVSNTEPPFFVGLVPERDTFFTFKGNCNEGLVELKVTGRDRCTPDPALKWTYKIDLYNNGVYEIINNGFGNMAFISYIMPVGWHRVQWTFEDQCGNVVTKDQLILMRDNEKPKAESLDNVSISVVPADFDNDGVADMEEACVFAWTLNANSTSLCCDEPLRFSYSADINDTLRCFTCADVGFTVPVQLWVHDCNGNTDFTVLNIEVQDNNDSDVCETICERFGPNAQIAGTTNICPGRSTVLTASGGTKYLWSNGQTTPGITVSPTSNTAYTVTVTNQLNCTASATATVVVNARPTAAIQGNNVCLGSSTTLTASGGVSYVWSTGQTNTNISVSPSVNTTYTVTVTNAAGCTATASRAITVNPLPTASISGDLNVCINESTTLTASGGNTYTWNTGATTAAITVSPAVTTTYTVTVTNTFGCTATTARTVVVNGLTINVRITGNTTICEGSNTTLTGSGGNTYIWSNSATTTNINVAPAASTTYRVTATDANGCTGTSATTVTVNALPQVTVTGNNVCQGASTIVAATGGTSYAWSTGQTTASFTVTPSATTNYVVTVTNASACTATGSRQITVNPLPTVSITGNNSICSNQSTTLTASGPSGATFGWSNGATTSSITVAPQTNTTYSVTVTSQQGCTASSSRQVTVNGLSINVAITGDNQICLGESTTLTASGGTSYTWSTGNTGANLTVSPTSSTIYSVTATDQNGCSGTSSRAVTVSPLPTARISGTAIICTGQATTLTASGGTSYTWSSGQTTAVITVTPTAFTSYRVTVSDANGCSSTASLSVIVNPLPTASITGDFSICVGESTTLTATGGTAFAWTTGATTASITVNPTSSQVYRVTVTNANNCTNTATATVTVTPPPTVSVTGDLTICVGESTTLTASAGSSYSWSTGNTTQSVTVRPTVNTPYTVTVTNASGCTGTATVTVQVDAGTLSCSTQNITVYLNQLGAVQIRPEDVSTSTFGLCSNITSTVNPSNFFCNDVGIRTVTLTVTNQNNNQSLNCTAQVTVRDTIKPTLVCPNNQSISCGVYVPGPLTNFGNPFVSDNCAVGLQLVETPLVNLGNCNIGVISRTFVVTDFSGNSRQCVQIINITNNDPFTAADINWPDDITVNNCIPSTAPSALGNTTVDQNTYSCASVSIGFQDNFPTTGPLCGGTYQRTWTVRDQCQAVPGTNAGVFTHIQTIVVNTVTPLITGPTDTLIYVDATNCEARLDGVFHTSSGCNLILSNSINSNANFDLSGIYPTGTTTVLLTAKESCNNLTDTHTFIVEVVDTSSFNIQCIKTFPQITDNLTVDEFASAHTHITYNCANQQDIVVSYSNSNINDTIRTYTCADVGSIFPVTIYFWHIGDPVPFTLCGSLARVEDPANFCLTPSPRIAGLVNTENGQAVPHVQVGLAGSNAQPAETGMNGLYTFPEMPAGGSYEVIPGRNDHPLDGVSTLDLILMQRHILGVQPITSPYKLIAADINHDDRISTSDMLQLRKVLLGIHADFPENTSWRMIDKSFKFPDSINPFLTPLKESYAIGQLNNTMVIDWVGVKIGDVNNSYETRFDGKQVEKRAQNNLLRLTNQWLVKGENVIPVYAAEDAQVIGFQTSIHLAHASNVLLTTGKIELEDGQYSFRNGDLNISWSQRENVDIKAGDILFYIHLFTEVPSSLSDVFGMNQGMLSHEMYTPSFTATPFSWRVEEGVSGVFAVHGNNPNPWDEETYIHFTLPESGKVILHVRDVTGRLVYQSEGSFDTGENTIRISKEQLGTTGILVYDLTYGSKTITLKMLNLK
jgi:predicted transcriptional regulator